MPCFEMKPRVIIESHIPGVPGWITEYFDVRRLSPSEIDRAAAMEADALVVRTRTRCAAPLLEGTGVKFVATATIGTDHMDIPWLESQGIEWANAPGCNAPAVAQYVFASLLRHPQVAARGIENLRMAVIGCGNVGRTVMDWHRRLTARPDMLLCVDPPRAERGEIPFESRKFLPLEQAVEQADIVTIHTPFTTSGKHPTAGMFDERILKMLPQGAIVVNAARGGIVDERALVRLVTAGHLCSPVIDCWATEPRPDGALLAESFVSTPHIAGYSAEGKQRATAMALTALFRHFGTKPWPHTLEIPEVYRGELTAEIIVRSYDPLADTAALRTGPTAFETLRNNYPLRRETSK